MQLNKSCGWPCTQLLYTTRNQQLRSRSSRQTLYRLQSKSRFTNLKSERNYQRRIDAVADQQLGSKPLETPRIAVFVSGGGSNFRAIHQAILEEHILAEIAVVVSDNPACGACQYAAAAEIAIATYPASKKDRGSSSYALESPAALAALLTDEFRVDYVLLAGYLKLVPKEVVAAFPKAMLNIHPGLLPAFGGKGFYGSKVHEAVVASGARFSGPTVHFVDENYDTGPILAQRVIPVLPNETPRQLAARILKEEHLLYPEAVAALVDQRISWRADGIPILWTAH